jgi:hypothetical protein
VTTTTIDFVAEVLRDSDAATWVALQRLVTAYAPVQQPRFGLELASKCVGSGAMLGVVGCEHDLWRGVAGEQADAVCHASQLFQAMLGELCSTGLALGFDVGDEQEGVVAFWWHWGPNRKVRVYV